jgi:hypothetical protein
MQSSQLVNKAMKSLATDRALVTWWLLALAGMPLPPKPLAMLPTVTPLPRRSN